MLKILLNSDEKVIKYVKVYVKFKQKGDVFVFSLGSSGMGNCCVGKSTSDEPYFDVLNI